VVCAHPTRDIHWIADAHRDVKRFVVRADEKQTAFVELESAIRVSEPGYEPNSSTPVDSS
jgi:hypothetical protein